MSRQAGKSHSASTQKLLDKYSSAFIRHKPVRAYQGYSAVPNEIRESAMFEQTPDDVMIFCFPYPSSGKNNW